MSAPAAAVGTPVAVLSTADLPRGASTTVEAFGTTVAIFNVDGELRAINNTCPHHGAPLCYGRVSGRLLPSAPHQYVWSDEPIVTCPWHGWQLDLRSGSTLFDDEVSVATYDVMVDGDTILLAQRDGRA